MDEILRSLNVLLEDLTPAQMQGLQKFAEKIKNPQNMNQTQATQLISELGLDLKKLQKNAKRLKSQFVKKQESKPKQKPNDKCNCGSDKKYKKCCIWKTEEKAEEKV